LVRGGPGMIAGQYDNGIEITCLVQVGRSGFLKKYQKNTRKSGKKG
tara:strand:+ start:350 stop:487 length:138 start_codon:yes stop_codon:yes gene_type:complete